MATTPSITLPAWLTELVHRLFTQKPQFFKWLQVIGIALTVVSGVPAFLQSVGVTLPAAIAAVSDKIVGIIGLVITVISQLTTDTSKVDNPATTLPFTTASNTAPTTTTK